MDDHLESLQGHWDVTSLEVDGTALPVAGARIIIEDDRFISLSMGTAYGGKIAVEAATTPKSFSLHFTEGPETGHTNHGIYEVEGNTWKICLNVNGGPPPKTFATAVGSGNALETLHRAGPASQSKPKKE
ncbi:MAG: TIGR03067 domain-containing protein [Bryobacteraceae bacterium]